MLGHQPQRVGQGLVRMDRDRVDHHAGLEFLDLADFGGLLVDRHVAVDDAEPAGLRHGDRQRRLGHGVHRRRDQRDAELDLAGDAGSRVGLAGQDADAAGTSITSSKVSAWRISIAQPPSTSSKIGWRPLTRRSAEGWRRAT